MIVGQSALGTGLCYVSHKVGSATKVCRYPVNYLLVQTNVCHMWSNFVHEVRLFVRIGLVSDRDCQQIYVGA